MIKIQLTKTVTGAEYNFPAGTKLEMVNWSWDQTNPEYAIYGEDGGYILNLPQTVVNGWPKQDIPSCRKD